MALRVTDPGKAAEKWVRRAGVAGPDYEAGVRGAGGAWEAGAKAANDAYKQGVTAAIGRDAYSKGISNAGAGKYERGAIEKGARRYPEGVAVGAGEYTSKVAPYLQALSSITLPPRGPSGDPRNLQRVSMIATTLAALKRR